MSTNTFYDIIGASREATKSDIDRAFEQRIDEFGGFDELPDSIHTAYMALKSSAVRAFYDWFLDSVERGTPVECDEQEQAQIEGYCKRWGYELVEHPDGPPGTWLIRKRVTRPPAIPEVGDNSMPKKSAPAPEESPPATTSKTPSEPQPERMPWPPPPLTMGNRIFHWVVSQGRILDVVRTHNFGQFQVQVDGEPDIKVWKREELRSSTCAPGDHLDIVSLCERAVSNRATYVGYVNLTRGGFLPLHYLIHAWTANVHYAKRPEYFGVRNQRAVDQLLERYFYELSYNFMRLCGGSDAESRRFASESARPAAKYHSQCWKRYW